MKEMDLEKLLNTFEEAELKKLAEAETPLALQKLAEAQGHSLCAAESELVFAAISPVRGKESIDDTDMEAVVGGYGPVGQCRPIEHQGPC